jgi:hypothetical protein
MDRLGSQSHGGFGRAGMLGVVVLTSVGAITAPFLRAQSAAAPKFEVAAIRPQKDCVPSGRPPDGSPTLSLGCQTVMSLIQRAYVSFANGHANSFLFRSREDRHGSNRTPTASTSMQKRKARRAMK